MRAFEVNVHDNVARLTGDVVAALAKSLEQRYEDGGLIEATVTITAAGEGRLRIAAEGMFNPAYSFSVATTVDAIDDVFGPLNW